MPRQRHRFPCWVADARIGRARRGAGGRVLRQVHAWFGNETLCEKFIPDYSRVYFRDKETAGRLGYDYPEDFCSECLTKRENLSSSTTIWLRKFRGMTEQQRRDEIGRLFGRGLDDKVAGWLAEFGKLKPDDQLLAAMHLRP